MSKKKNRIFYFQVFPTIISSLAAVKLTQPNWEVIANQINKSKVFDDGRNKTKRRTLHQEEVDQAEIQLKRL